MVSEFLPDGPAVQIQRMYDVNSLTDSGKVNFRQGATVKIFSVGKVVPWDRATSTLVISPIAIY